MTTGTAGTTARQDPRQVVNTLKKTINYNDVDVAASNLDNYIPLGAIILDVVVSVVTVFNGTTPTLKMGKSSSYNELIDTTDVELTALGGTKVARGIGGAFAASADTAVQAQVTLTNATTGQLVVVITYEGGWTT